MDPSTRLASMAHITRYDEAAELLVRARDVMQSKEREADYLPLKRDTLTYLAGAAHNERRRMETSLFARTQLARYEQSVLRDSLERRLTAVVTRSAGQGGAGQGDTGRDDAGQGGVVPVDLLHLVRYSLMPVTADLVGLEVEETPQWWDRLSYFIHMFGVAAALQWKEGDIEAERDASNAAAVAFDTEVFTPAWDRRLELVERHERGEIGRAEVPHDLITALMVHLPGRPRDVILRETILFFSASTDTSTMAVATAVHGLLTWLERHPEDGALVGDYGFVQRVAFEAIRIQPPPGLIRCPNKDLTLASGRSLPAGEQIFIDLVAANTDRDVFGADAREFNPHRTVPDGVKHYGLAFGGGAHKCIGRPLAMSHDSHGPDTDDSDELGIVVRVLHRLLQLGVRWDPAHPPVRRTGNRQARFETFPVQLTATGSVHRLQEA